MAEKENVIPASASEGYALVDAMDEFILSVISFDEQCKSIWNVSLNDKNLKGKLQSYEVPAIFQNVCYSANNLLETLDVSRKWFLQIGCKDRGKNTIKVIRQLNAQIFKELAVVFSLGCSPASKKEIEELLQYSDDYRRSLDKLIELFLKTIDSFRNFLVSNKWHNPISCEQKRNNLKLHDEDSIALQLVDSICNFILASQKMRELDLILFKANANIKTNYANYKTLANPQKEAINLFTSASIRLSVTKTKTEKWLLQNFSLDEKNELENEITYTKIVITLFVYGKANVVDFRDSINKLNDLASKIRSKATEKLKRPIQPSSQAGYNAAEADVSNKPPQLTDTETNIPEALGKNTLIEDKTQFGKSAETGQKIMPEKYIKLAEQIASNLEDWANPKDETGLRYEYVGHLKPINIALEGFNEILNWLHLNRAEEGKYVQAAYDELISKAKVDDALLEKLYDGDEVFSEQCAIDLADALRLVAKTAGYVFVGKPIAPLSEDEFIQGTGDEWITVGVAAKLLGVNPGVVSRWATEGEIKDNRKTGRNRRVLKSSVLLRKHKREHEDLLRDAAEDLQDRANKIPDRH